MNITPNYIENDNRPEFDKLHDDIYESLGRFLVSFEELLSTITRSIKFALFKNGLNNDAKGSNIADIVLSEMDAMKLVNRHTAIFSSAFPEKEKELRLLGTELRKLVETRNEIVHGKFFIHLGSMEGKDFPGYNHKTRFSLDKGFENYPKWHFKEAYNTSTVLRTYVELLFLISEFHGNEKFLERLTEENIKNKKPVAGCRLYNPSGFK